MEQEGEPTNEWKLRVDRSKESDLDPVGQDISQVATDLSGAALPIGSELPEVTTSSPPSKALFAFAQIVECTHETSRRFPGWWLSQAIREFDGLCAYCGRSIGYISNIDAVISDVDAIIPFSAGGPHRPDAVVLCCKACKLDRHRRDLLLWKPDIAAKLTAMRARLAFDTWNHLSRNPASMRTKKLATEVIAKRWLHPRFRCHGALLSTGGFIGWHNVSQVPSTVQYHLAFEHGGWRLRQTSKKDFRRNDKVAIFWIPTRQRALDAIWDVIEHNGLVRHVALEASPPPSKASVLDPDHDWARVFPTVIDLVSHHRRRQ